MTESVLMPAFTRSLAAFVLAMCCLVPGERAWATQAPIAAYSFDDGTGASLTDASGNFRNGTIVGATWTTGKFGSALSFDGASARVDLPALGTFYKTGFTLEAWVKRASNKTD